MQHRDLRDIQIKESEIDALGRFVGFDSGIRELQRNLRGRY